VYEKRILRDDDDKDKDKDNDDDVDDDNDEKWTSKRREEFS
jgi:hypothetical protein